MLYQIELDASVRTKAHKCRIEIDVKAYANTNDLINLMFSVSYRTICGIYWAMNFQSINRDAYCALSKSARDCSWCALVRIVETQPEGI